MELPKLKDSLYTTTTIQPKLNLQVLQRIFIIIYRKVHHLLKKIIISVYNEERAIQIKLLILSFFIIICKKKRLRKSKRANVELLEERDTLIKAW